MCVKQHVTLTFHRVSEAGLALPLWKAMSPVCSQPATGRSGVNYDSSNCFMKLASGDAQWALPWEHGHTIAESRRVRPRGSLLPNWTWTFWEIPLTDLSCSMQTCSSDSLTPWDRTDACLMPPWKSSCQHARPALCRKHTTRRISSYI